MDHDSTKCPEIHIICFKQQSEAGDIWSIDVPYHCQDLLCPRVSDFRQPSLHLLCLEKGVESQSSDALCFHPDVSLYRIHDGQLVPQERSGMERPLFHMSMHVAHSTKVTGIQIFPDSFHHLEAEYQLDGQ